MSGFDPGPPAAFEALFAAAPLPSVPADFWTDWGPVFYRGRLDGSARVLCIASDPGPTERIAARTLVGDAGQRLQGFLTKLGLTSSYLCLNAFPYALFPSESATTVAKLLADPAQLAWRNQLYNLAVSSSPHLQALVAFGANAKLAVKQWTGRPAGLPLFEVPHPTSHDEQTLLQAWKLAVPKLRQIVTADADGDATVPNYGSSFSESDYTAIPRADLPFGAATFLGDDSWARAESPPLRTTVSRPSPDDRHTLIWVAPRH